MKTNNATRSCICSLTYDCVICMESINAPLYCSNTEWYEWWILLMCVPHWLPLQHKYNPKMRPGIDKSRTKKGLSYERLMSPVINAHNNKSNKYRFRILLWLNRCKCQYHSYYVLILSFLFHFWTNGLWGEMSDTNKYIHQFIRYNTQQMTIYTFESMVSFNQQYWMIS